MLTKVTRLETVGGFRLRVHFSDGSFGEHDFSALVSRPGEMIIPLHDDSYFARVFLEDGAPTWPNGYDMAPEWLRREMEAAGEMRRDGAEESEARVSLDKRRMRGRGCRAHLCSRPWGNGRPILLSLCDARP